MTLQQIRYAVAVEYYGSFSEAARQLYISQPSMSAMIRDLEKELGITLFKRTGQGAVLTPEGKEFLIYAYRMLDCEKEIVNRYTSKSTGSEIRYLSVASQHYTFASRAMLRIMKESEHLKYDFFLSESHTQEIIKDVSRQKAEIGLLCYTGSSESFMEKLLKSNYVEFHPLVRSTTCAFMNTTHPLAEKKIVTAEDLSRYPCIIYDQANDSQLSYSEENTLENLRLQNILRVTDVWTATLAMQELNAFNIGSGIYSEDDKGLIAIPIEGTEKTLIGYVALENSILSPLAQLFIDYVREELRIEKGFDKELF